MARFFLSADSNFNEWGGNPGDFYPWGLTDNDCIYVDGKPLKPGGRRPPDKFLPEYDVGGRLTPRGRGGSYEINRGGDIEGVSQLVATLMAEVGFTYVSSPLRLPGEK